MQSMKRGNFRVPSKEGPAVCYRSLVEGGSLSSLEVRTTPSSEVERSTHFPVKLWDVVDDKSCEIFRWSEDGRSFYVDDSKYESQIMTKFPGFVQIPSFANLRRLLREYDFQWKNNEPSGEFQFSNPNFLRENQSLLSEIRTRRKTLNSSTHNASTSKFKRRPGGDSTDRKSSCSWLQPLPKGSVKLRMDTLMRFPEKIWAVVNDPGNDLLFWGSEGMSLIVDDKKFEEEVMQRYPGLVKISSFANLRRLLREYGFTWSIRENGFYEFSHPALARDRPDLLRGVKTKRKALKSGLAHPYVPMYKFDQRCTTVRANGFGDATFESSMNQPCDHRFCSSSSISAGAANYSTCLAARLSATTGIVPISKQHTLPPPTIEGETPRGFRRGLPLCMGPQMVSPADGYWLSAVGQQGSGDKTSTAGACSSWPEGKPMPFQQHQCSDLRTDGFTTLDLSSSKTSLVRTDSTHSYLPLVAMPEPMALLSPSQSETGLNSDGVSPKAVGVEAVDHGSTLATEGKETLIRAGENTVIGPLGLGELCLACAHDPYQGEVLQGMHNRPPPPSGCPIPVDMSQHKGGALADARHLSFPGNQSLPSSDHSSAVDQANLLAQSSETLASNSLAVNRHPKDLGVELSSGVSLHLAGAQPAQYVGPSLISSTAPTGLPRGATVYYQQYPSLSHYQQVYQPPPHQLATGLEVTNSPPSQHTTPRNETDANVLGTGPTVATLSTSYSQLNSHGSPENTSMPPQQPCRPAVGDSPRGMVENRCMSPRDKTSPRGSDSEGVGASAGSHRSVQMLNML